MSDDPIKDLKAMLQRMLEAPGDPGGFNAAPTPGCRCTACVTKWLIAKRDDPVFYEQQRAQMAIMLNVPIATFDPTDGAVLGPLGVAVEAVRGAHKVPYDDVKMTGIMSAAKMKRLMDVSSIEVRGTIEAGAPVFVPNKPAPAAPAQSKEKEESKMAVQAKNLVTQRIEADDEVEVVEGGKKIVLPKGMTFDEAREWLARRENEQNQPFAVLETIEAHPLDGAWALHKALAKKYGWTKMEKTPPQHIFDKARPPIMVGVEVAPGKTIQVAWGRISIPNVVGFIETAFTEKNGRIVFELRGEVLKKHASEIAELATLARKYAKEESLYRGAAIRASFSNKRDANGNLFFNILDVPKFMDVEDDKAKELVFSDSVNEQIRTSLFVPIEKTELCRKHKIPLKRGVLLEGRYGVGKTLTAYVAARKCVENGWTFIYIEHVAELEAALKFAAQYQPAMIFAEDVDRVVEGERSVAMDDILNTLDGIEAKASETIVVLTTNHVEKINKAMLRPGRLDAVISVLPPDADAVAKLLRLYGRGLLDAATNVAGVSAMLAGQIPAVIREVVERSKLAAISRLDVGELRIDAEDLATAAKGMLSHLALLESDDKGEMSNEEMLGTALGSIIEEALERVDNEQTEDVEA